MFESILVLAADDSAIFTVRNGILVAVLVAVVVGYKVWKNKTMS